MELKVWCIFASVLLVSAGAVRFDQGPQKFYESSSPAPQREQNVGNNEVVLYLTPGQIKALEASGAVVRPAESDNDPDEIDPEEALQDSEENAEQEQEQEQEQEENENEAEEPEQQEEAEQPEQDQESAEELQSQDLDFEEILRILNEEQIEEEEAKAEQPFNVPQVTEETSEEENSDEEREIPPRFQVLQKQQQQRQQQQQQRQERYLAPTEQNMRSKIYAAIRYQQRNVQNQRARVQPQQQQETRQNQEQQEIPQTEAVSALKRYKLVPYEVEEQPEEQQEQQTQQEQQEQEKQQELQQQAEEQRAEQEENEERLNALLTPLLSPQKLAEVIGQRKNRLFQNEIELQTILNELKQSPKHNDQKYAIEIERLRANLQKQNTLAKAEAIAKTAPQIIRKEILKRRPSQSAKQSKMPPSAARNLEPKGQRASRPLPVPVEVIRPVPIPVLKKQKIENKKPVPVEVEKRVPVTVSRNVYVKVNKPYLVPVAIRKDIPVENPIRKPQKVTIIRNV